jgi:hypothetical protein
MEEATESIIFWYLRPCSLIEFYRRFRGAYCLHLQGRSVSHLQSSIRVMLSAYLFLFVCLIYCSTLKMEAVLSSEMSVTIYQITRRPRLHSCETWFHSQCGLRTGGKLIQVASFPPSCPVITLFIEGTHPSRRSLIISGLPLPEERFALHLNLPFLKKNFILYGWLPVLRSGELESVDNTGVSDTQHCILTLTVTVWWLRIIYLRQVA